MEPVHFFHCTVCARSFTTSTQIEKFFSHDVPKRPSMRWPTPWACAIAAINIASCTRQRISLTPIPNPQPFASIVRKRLRREKKSPMIQSKSVELLNIPVNKLSTFLPNLKCKRFYYSRLKFYRLAQSLSISMF